VERLLEREKREKLKKRKREEELFLYGVDSESHLRSRRGKHFLHHSFKYNGRFLAVVI